MKDEVLTGIFDSGVGGLSVLKELISFGGNYIYYGDTKNLPYGNKTKEEIISFTRNIINFFIEKGAKKAIMACNTSSALAFETLKGEFNGKIKIYPLIQTVAPHIAKQGQKIGIMATEGTVKSLTYTKEIKKNNINIQVFELACPKFVEIVENRMYNDAKSINYIKEHLDFLLDKKCDKIVLGCTHYPYLMPILSKFANKELFINPALYMKEIVKNDQISQLKLDFYVSDAPETFRENAKLFLDIKQEIKLAQNSTCPV